MGLFDRLTNPQAPQAHQPTQEEIAQEARRVSADPAGYLKPLGYSIPQGMTDPRQITRHLLQTGQVTPPRLQQVMRMLGRR